jgi:hypothetical protein
VRVDEINLQSGSPAASHWNVPGYYAGRTCIRSLHAPAVLVYSLVAADGPPPRLELVRHVTLGLSWRVDEVLQAWTHPYCFSTAFRESAELRRYKFRVHGPLPGRPGEKGEFILVARLYRDRRGWWTSSA